MLQCSRQPTDRKGALFVAVRASGSSGPSFCMNYLWLSQHVLPNSPKSTTCSIYVNGMVHARMGVWVWRHIEKSQQLLCCCHAVQFVILYAYYSNVLAWCRRARRIYLVQVYSLSMHRACILYAGACCVCLRGMIIRRLAVCLVLRV